MAQRSNSLDESAVLAKIEVGAYGKVFAGTVCAAKEFLSLKVGCKGARQENVKCRRMLQLCHPNIVQFLGVCSKPGLPTVLLLVMKMMDCSLNTLLEYYPNVSVATKLSILLGMSLGLKFLHSQKPSVVHRNLLSNDILVTPHLQAKLSDVGVALPKTKTICFLAPEICKSTTSKLAGKLVDLSVEVFSYCAITLHTITQQWPKSKRQLNCTVNQYQSCIDQIISNDKKLGLLVVGCLDDVPDEHSSIDEVLEKFKRILEKCAVTKKSVITCQPEVRQVAKQESHLENKKMEQSKQKQKEIQRLKDENYWLCKQIHLPDTTLEVSDLQTRVGDLEEQLELKKWDIINLNKQINSLHHQLSGIKISKNSDGVKEMCTIADKKDNEHSKKTIEIPLEKSLVQVNVPPQKQRNESAEKDQDEKQTSSRMNSQQDQPKEQKQTELACHGSTNNHLEQENRRDDDVDQQQSNRDDQHIQGGSKKNKKRAFKKKRTKQKLDDDIKKPLKNDKESKCITEQQANEVPEEKITEEKDNSHRDQLIQRELKNVTQVSIKSNLEQANVTSPKNELGQREEDKNQKSSKSNSHQDESRKQKKKTNKDQAAYQEDTNDQFDRKDMLSNRDGQCVSKKNGKSDSSAIRKPKNHDKKGKQSTSTSGVHSHNQLCHKVIGFYNEGNTCFFNAMLQCIHQTVDLHHAIAEGKREYVINTSKGPLAIEVTKKSGQLTVDMRRLFYEISRQTGPISPHSLLQTIGRRNSRFGHGTQEDSHEVLRYLLSVLREEEIECIKQVLSHRGIKGEFLSDESVDKETKLYVKECLSKVSKGICDIDCIFGSYLISTTICHGCEIPLQTTEFNFDLSLPMPEDTKAQEVPVHPSKKGKGKWSNGQNGTPSNTTTATHAHAVSSEESSRIPEVVKSQQKFNLHLQKENFFHCSYSNTEDLKLETALEHSLLAFTSIDTLDEDNKFICQACSDGKPDVVLCCVSKQILIHKSSPVLILHIKRFKIGSGRVSKDNGPLSFPFVLDMAPFCTTECIERFGDSDRKILYGLYAVVEHNGSLHGGHYTTYVRQRPIQRVKDIRSAEHSDIKLKRKYNRKAGEEGEWYYTNDWHTSKCDPNTVLNCRPYLLFYEMLPKM